MFIDGLACLRHMPAVYSADNLYSHDALDTQREIRMIQKIISRVRGVTVASSAAEKLFRDTYQLPEQAEIFCVPHRNYIGKYPDDISKAEARSALGLPSSAPVVLSLGRITPYKGLAGLVSTFLEADVADAILLIAGSEKVPGTVEGIKAVASNSGRHDSIRIHNRFIPDNQIQLYLRAADLMALSYEDVPMNPGSVILAMSFGLPVCCVAEGSVPEILGDALYGYNRSDKVGQAAALREALLNIDALGDRGRIARRRAEINHSAEVVAERLKAVYRHVLP
jgi:glycosyltransferase involved in cell wall biosynthesis